MKRIITALAAVLLTAAGLILVTEAPASATQTTNCKHVAITFGNDVDICMTIGWTRVSATRLTLNNVTITCSPGGSMEYGNCVEGQVLNVRSDTGAIVWSSAQEPDIPNPPGSRTFDFANRYVNTRYLNGYYQGVVQAGGTGQNEPFQFYTYTPSS